MNLTWPKHRCSQRGPVLVIYDKRESEQSDSLRRKIALSLTHWRDVWRRARGRGMYPHELAFLLTLPLRRMIQPPQRLAARLALFSEARVLEVSPGPGYFSPAVAARVPRGRLVLLDMQLEMLAKARRRRWKVETSTSCRRTPARCLSAPASSTSFSWSPCSAKCRSPWHTSRRSKGCFVRMAYSRSAK